MVLREGGLRPLTSPLRAPLGLLKVLLGAAKVGRLEDVRQTSFNQIHRSVICTISTRITGIEMHDCTF